MILAFMTKFPKGLGTLSGRSTFFVEKIWQSFPDEKTADIFSGYLDGMEMVDYDFSCDAISLRAKKHTIRKDERNRWKVGMDIHFFINVRTKKMFKFAPIVKVKLIQKISIKPNAETFRVKIDDHFLSDDEIEKLSINDGFNSVEEFFSYFNEDFTGRLIHWTNVRY